MARAPVPERDALAGIEAEVAALAARCPALSAGNLDVLLRMQPGAVIAKLLPEALARAIATDLHANYAAATAKPLAPAMRAKELARLDADLLAAEVAEEAAIRAAEARGEQVDRRADADPRAVLAHMEDAA